MSASQKKSSIFRTIPRKLVLAERRMAILHGKSLDGVASIIYGNFFKLTKVEQDILILQAEDKKMGRGIK